jgi:uncharacterized protein (TIGR02001 family)
MSIFKYSAVIAMMICPPAFAQVMERTVGDFDIKLGTSPIRSMAQGLVSPVGGANSFHGGLDLTHESGLYFGQWTPSLGVTEGSTLEIDTYAGFKKPFDDTLGYELGLIRYSHPDTKQLDSYEFYSGFRVLDKRFGTAFSSDLGRSVSTVFIDLGDIEQLGLGVRMQYATHQFTSPQIGSNGATVTGFNDWSVNVSRSWMGVDMNLTYSGSTLDPNDCSLYSGHNQRCEQAVVLKAVRSFF